MTSGSITNQFRGMLLVSLMRAISFALLSPVIALALKEYLGTDAAVSRIMMLAYCIAIFSTIVGSWIFTKIGRRTGMIFSLAAYIVFLLSFAASSHIAILISSLILYTFMFSLLQLGISQYIDHLSTKRNLATHFGENGTLVNLGWILGPALGGLLASTYSYRAVFVLSALVVFVSLILFIFFEPKDSHPKKKNRVERAHIHARAFFKNPFFRKVYLLGLGINIVYGALILGPLFFQELGASVQQIGLYFALMAIPWIVLEFPIGALADKKKNEPTLFLLSYLIITIAIFGFGQSNLPTLAAVFLIGIAIGTSLLETTIFSYYYRYVPESEEKMTGVFLTHPNVGIFIGTLLPSILLSFMSLGTFFSLLALILLLFVGIAMRFKKEKAVMEGN